MNASTSKVESPWRTQRVKRFSVKRWGWTGGAFLALMIVVCAGSLPWALERADANGTRRFEAGDSDVALVSPTWMMSEKEREELRTRLPESDESRWRYALGTDRLGRDFLLRCLMGGVISLGVGIAAAATSVLVGTLYGITAGMSGGKIDAFMMRAVDVMYGLPSVLLVVLIAVAADGLRERMRWESGSSTNTAMNLGVMFIAIGGVSWLTMARVIRGQVLSLKSQAFMEACTVMGMGRWREYRKHVLPSLVGPIVVYATLTVPTAILMESFLSYLGIGVREPIPSWGNLASSGLSELNMVKSRWWLIVSPCLLLALTLVSLSLVGEAMRAKFDVRKGATRG
ncbi:MAG TPA: ABC transporter permease [Phycisphaerales bacterium]|nr:ABC transporter permease [Phycisphaerales bacterium]